MSDGDADEWPLVLLHKDDLRVVEMHHGKTQLAAGGTHGRSHFFGSHGELLVHIDMPWVVEGRLVVASVEGIRHNLIVRDDAGHVMSDLGMVAACLDLLNRARKPWFVHVEQRLQLEKVSRAGPAERL